MEGNIDGKRRWSDADLCGAVAKSRSWRGVMRELGVPVTSPRLIRAAKQDLVRMGIGTSHFTGKRTWSDPQLKRAAANAQSWGELLTELGLDSGSGNARARVKAHAVRLGLDLGKLRAPDVIDSPELSRKPDVVNLREAATSLSAAWFLMRGYNPSLPIEPTVYDLVVSTDDGIKRVQVKTTACNTKDGWLARVGRRPYSAGNRNPLIPYDPDVIDLFFIVDGDLTMYLIPSRVIAGRTGLVLRNYTRYIVGNSAGLMGAKPAG